MEGRGGDGNKGVETNHNLAEGGGGIFLVAQGRCGVGGGAATAWPFCGGGFLVTQGEKEVGLFLCNSHRVLERKPNFSSQHSFAQSQCPRETSPLATEQLAFFLPEEAGAGQAGRAVAGEDKSSHFLSE